MSNQKLFEEMLACHCAPALGKYKTANMFHVERSTIDNIEELINFYNLIFNEKKIGIQLFQATQHRYTIFVFSFKDLENVLHQRNVQKFLSAYGYKDFSISGSFKHLEYRLNHEGEYPHEIGLFLGYPLEDVQGFIEKKPCTLIGTWKVYTSNVMLAKEKFKLYELARKEYINKVKQGITISQIIH